VSDNPDDAIVAAHALAPADPRQAAARDENTWITESFELAKQVVYQPPVSVGPEDFALTDAYQAQAVQIAKQRLVLAGTRLAMLLNTALAAPVDPRLGCDTASMLPPQDLSQPENIDFVKKRMLFYRCNGYDEDVAKVLASVGSWIASRASQVQHPAVVFDIDETSLSNWPRILLDDFAYIPNATCSGKVGDICGDLGSKAASPRRSDPRFSFTKRRDASINRARARRSTYSLLLAASKPSATTRWRAFGP
jgi:hypothetical protein